MLFKNFLFLACFTLVACSGNSGSSSSVPDSNLKRFSGVVNNSSTYGASISVIPVGKHGQFRLNAENQIDAVTLSSDERGRYGLVLKTDEVGAFVISANAPNAPVISETGEEIEPDIAPAKMQCQIVSGCLITSQSSPVAFGDSYPMPAKFQWSAAVEFISAGQFVVINPITAMSTLLGFSTYVNAPTDTGVSLGKIAAPGYYSSYGIVKANSQTANLLGLTDILSVEPINLFSLHDVSVSDSNSLQDSIRYGALLAAWQALELDYNNAIVEGDFTFQQQVIFEFYTNKGQLYQAAPLDGQVLSMKAWYRTAAANLIAARDYHMSLARSVPNEVNLVIARLEQEISGFKNEKLTVAEYKITEQLSADYTDAVAKSKAMVNYISDLGNNFADEEYRQSVQDSSDLATGEIKRLAPKFDVLMKQLLSVHEYYLSCVNKPCDTASPWHLVDNIYDEESKKLSIVQSESTTLELSQAKVFSQESPEGSEKTYTHSFLIEGSFEFEGLRFELSNFTAENQAPIKSSISFSYSKPLLELPQLPALIVGGRGARVDETLVPDVIELALPSFKLYDSTTLATEKEMTLSGVLSLLMVANVDTGDFSEAITESEKLGKRYNLANVSATLKLIGASQGALEDKTELRDNAVLSFQAAASEAVVSKENPSAYFPDTVYPTLKSFFKPREGFQVGKDSPSSLVVSRRGIMDFPKLNSEGVEVEGETVEVAYLELDYEIGGLERYVAYPKIGQDEKFFGLVCSATSADEKDLVGTAWTKEETDAENNTKTRSLLTCRIRDKYIGDAVPDTVVKWVYIANKDLVSLREYNGQGAYRMDYPTTTTTITVTERGEEKEKTVEILEPFLQGEDTHAGKIEQSIVLGVDSMRLQFQPEFVNNAATGFLPETVFDVSLIWRRHDLIDVNVFLAFNADEKFNNPDGSGLPYLGVGNDVESYSVAYRTDESGKEVGEFAFAWSGIQFVDGPIGANGKPIKVMRRTSDESLKEGFITEIGSNVVYRDYTQREKDTLNIGDDSTDTKEKCGFFNRGQRSEEGENCSAIAYLTFRGLVTGVLREERDGAYVIRYIDDSWQVLGAK